MSYTVEEEKEKVSRLHRSGLYHAHEYIFRKSNNDRILNQEIDAGGIRAETAVVVSISVDGVKVQFSGNAESVMSSVLSFLSKEVPSLDLARKITLSFTAQDLIDSYGHLIKFTPEGPRVMPDSESMFSDKDIVALQLIASKLAKELGKISDDALLVSEIHSATALNPRSISSRISEMVKAGHVARSEEPGKYRITTAGIQWLGQAVAAKKAKTAGR